VSALLELRGVEAGHGDALVLRGVDLTLQPGQALALLGRNGVGKTTLIETIAGLTQIRAGAIRLRGADVTRTRPERRASLGLGWVPQERAIFPSLTVEENLTATARPGSWTLARVYNAFPRLAERRANYGRQLSGGEQQMLAVGRALMLNPSLLLLDEPLEGLAPIVAQDLLAALRGIVAGGEIGAIIVEQKARAILPLTETAVVLDRGAVVWSGGSADLLADDAALDRLLGVGRTQSREAQGDRP
jgi:branched-chain amino acid transport system ATP-binding protein